MREGIIVSFLMKNPISNNFTSQNISFVFVDGLGNGTVSTNGIYRPELLAHSSRISKK